MSYEIIWTVLIVMNLIIASLRNDSRYLGIALLLWFLMEKVYQR